MSQERDDFRRFAEDTYDHVFRATYLAIGERDIAAEGTQEAFAKAFARWRRLSTEPWAEGWVITTAINFCKRSLRRRKGERSSDSTFSEPLENTVSAKADLFKALKELSLRQREAVVLHYLAEVPVRGVADLMKVSEGTVKAHLSHARQRLRSELEVSDV